MAEPIEIHGLIDNYPENSRFLATVNYNRPQRDDKGNWQQDSFTLVENVVIKDPETGKRKIKKQMIHDTEPLFKFYMDKDKSKYDVLEKRMFVEKEKTKEVICPYRDLGLAMAQEAGYERWYKENSKINKYEVMKKMQSMPYFHQSDQNIEDFIIGNYYDNVGSQLFQAPPLRKAFFDIEVDTHETREFPEKDNPICPVNAISFYDNYSNKEFLFLLRYPDNPDFVEFEKNVDKYRREAMNGLPIEQDGKTIKPLVIEGSDGKEKFLKDCKIFFFDTDEELIRRFFYCVNELCRPDFLMAWNLNFDFNYLMARFEYLTRTPACYLFCPDEWPFKICYYNEDTKNMAWSQKGDYTNVSGWGQYVDQLIVYASIRATKDKLDDYSLNTVTEKELGVHKLDIGGSMHDFCIRDYKRFAKYSLVDTFLLWRLENKVHDIDMIYNISVLSRTRFHKAWKKTISLKNLAYKFFYDEGFIVSNNHNADNADSEKFPGAFVLEPNIDHVGINFYGKKSNRLFRHVCDFDYSSLYPRLILLCMIEAANQYGRITRVNDITLSDDSYRIMELLISKDYLKIGSELFNLPNKNEILKFMNQVMKKVA